MHSSALQLRFWRQHALEQRLYRAVAIGRRGLIKIAAMENNIKTNDLRPELARRDQSSMDNALKHL